MYVSGLVEGTSTAQLKIDTPQSKERKGQNSPGWFILCASCVASRSYCLTDSSTCITTSAIALCDVCVSRSDTELSLCRGRQDTAASLYHACTYDPNLHYFSLFPSVSHLLAPTRVLALQSWSTSILPTNRPGRFPTGHLPHIPHLLHSPYDFM